MFHPVALDMIRKIEPLEFSLLFLDGLHDAPHIDDFHVGLHGDIAGRDAVNPGLSDECFYAVEHALRFVGAHPHRDDGNHRAARNGDAEPEHRQQHAHPLRRVLHSHDARAADDAAQEQPGECAEKNVCPTLVADGAHGLDDPLDVSILAVHDFFSLSVNRNSSDLNAILPIHNVRNIPATMMLSDSDSSLTKAFGNDRPYASVTNTSTT